MRQEIDRIFAQMEGVYLLIHRLLYGTGMQFMECVQRRSTSSSDGNSMSIVLHDNRPGISQDYLSRIFQPVVTIKQVGKGTGLGLSISYGIIEQLAGRLHVRNHPQGGVAFVIELLLAAASAP